jgi:hypothetical protein
VAYPCHNGPVGAAPPCCHVHASPSVLPKGTLTKMDRPCRAMLWKAVTVCFRDDCQVNWDLVCQVLRKEV